MQGGIKFISAWQRFLVRTLSYVVALAVSLRPAFDLHRDSPFVLTLLYTKIRCTSIGNVHKVLVYVLCIMCTCKPCIFVI